ncbi:SMP-30/gluconolactonase/LRE family protein [Microbacterium sp.]|uniref:SMP-30/gluconolactonase/LRE family protein n=1 Tax=Microbacterium sp. TaxID=51671 RepID=UPI0039E3FDF3
MTHERIPARFEALDPRFAGIGGDRELRVLFDDGRWLEGPAYSPQGRFLLFSDIPNDRVLRYDEVSGAVHTWDARAGFTNGRTVDREGRFVQCEHGGRRVVRFEHDGSASVVADSYQGRRLNSPNDVVVHTDGSVWFTDPHYGIRNDYEGHRGDEEIGSRNVYRWSEDDGLVAASDALDGPNGLAFSPDGAFLYVSDSEHRSIVRFPVEGARLGEGSTFATADVIYDGLRIDTEGRVWAAAEDGVHVYHPDGEQLGRLAVPQVVSNLEFGGPQRNLLYLTATSRLYVLRVTVQGVSRMPSPSGAVRTAAR